MKYMIIGLILSVAAGCAHVSQSVQMQDGEIEGYRAMALRALNSPEAWRQHQVLMTFSKRQVDVNRTAWFDIKAGSPPIISVWIPTTETDRANAFVVFEFDHSNHTLKGIGLGSLNQ